MSSQPLPFEKAFRSWIEKEGMGWTETEFDAAPGDEAMGAYRLTPRDKTERVVFALHGAGNDALFGWVGLFKELLLAGSEIFTFDLPGHGRASRTVFDPSAARRAISTAFAHCAADAGGAPVHAIGVSLGGALLLSTLSELGAGLSSASLIVAPLRINLSAASLLSEFTHRTLQLVWREREHYGLTGLIPSFGPFRRDIYPLRLAESPPPGAFGYIHALNRALEAMRLEEEARLVDLPVLLVYGDYDRVVPVEQGERLAGVLPQSELLRVAMGTHLSTPLAPVVRQRLLSWMQRWD